MKSVFYVRDGLSVRREDNGDVTLIVEATAADEMWAARREFRLPVNEFASLVAYLTPAGGNAETFGAALRFLNGDELPPVHSLILDEAHIDPEAAAQFRELWDREMGGDGKALRRIVLASDNTEYHDVAGEEVPRC